MEMQVWGYGVAAIMYVCILIDSLPQIRRQTKHMNRKNYDDVRT